MKTSVIIPTYNGAHKILNVLHCLEQQNHAPDEVIVVIDGSTDNTKEVLSTNKFSFTELKIIEQENGGRAKVRNRGAQEASGELLIFFDDDMRPVPECVMQHVAHHVCYGGSIMTGFQIEEITVDTPEFVQFKGYLSRKWYSPYLKNNKIDSVDRIFLTAANLSISKDLFISLGGFDERLTDAEDYDLAVRACLKHIPIYVNPAALAWHDDPITCADYIRRQKEYKLAHQKLAGIKPELHQGRTDQSELRRLSLVKNFFLSLFAHPFWVATIDKNTWTMLLSKKLRYKLYDFVITAHIKRD